MKLKTDKKINVEKGMWNFSGKVPDNFVKHAKKSIPHYEENHKLILDYSDFFCKKDSVIHEIGSSTGELAFKFYERFKNKNIKYFGLDVELAMTKYSKTKINSSNKKIIKFINDDIVKCKIQKSDIIVSYYTIQFIEPKYRQEVFDKIYKSLNWGGAFFLFEKVRAPDARYQDMNTNLYNNFKLENGFNHSEIFNKTESLKSVLEPYSTKANLDFLKRSGFQDMMSIYKYVSFEGFLAIK